MKREIKFRGKDTNTGEWVFGDLIQLDTQLCIAGLNQWAGVPANNSIEIDVTKIVPETVGQFTGLKDKNGVDIYEGDIIEFVTFFTKDTVVEQVWIDEYACLHPFFDPFYVDDEQGAGIEDETIKVLGNIHDKVQQKQALIDMMRDDEELGLYDDNPKNHGYER